MRIRTNCLKNFASTISYKSKKTLLKIRRHSGEEDMRKPPPDPVYTLKGSMASVCCLLYKICAKAELLYAATQDGKVHVWNLKSCREKNIITVGNEPCLSLHSLDNYFITQEKCGNIKIWVEDGEGWTLQHTIMSTYVGFCRLQIGNNCIIFPEQESAVTVRTLNGEILENISTESTERVGNVMALNYQVILKDEYIFIMYESGVLILWKMRFGKVSCLKMTSDCPMTLDFDGNSRGIIGTSGDNLIEFFVNIDFSLSKGRNISITNPGVSCVKIRPDKLIFVAGCWDGRIRFFSMKTLKLLAVLDQHQGSVHDVIFSDKPVRIWKCNWLCACGGLDKKITLWNLYN